ncbi:MAG: SGNH/GDSL hydrolase family protein [Chromatiaceae bacterium]|nr:SGNH/GDSL hydrolase family protein [Gammaproteobacteria bacterium]MCP5448134.1 SGNH/GDSL hydrolase family protein [Chromatiaceae bacterium]
MGKQPEQRMARSRKRHFLFAVFSVFLSGAASLYIAEWCLSYQRHSIERSDRLQPGMILYDPRLGWRLNPNWRGSHQHHDFNVEYSINRFGFRGRPPSDTAARRYAVVGDSFSFGQGVGDDATFVELLNSASGKAEFLNFGVPGYSTDQQYLLIRERVKLFEPDGLLLVVYLGNDLFDNARPFPLQGDHAKPYYRLHPDGTLELLNTPVPRESMPAAARTDNLTQLVLGESQSPPTVLQRWLGDFEITRRLGLFQPDDRVDDAGFAARFSYHRALFKALIERISGSARELQAALTVVLLPGRSYVDNPASVSAGYQDFLRRSLLSDLSSMADVETIDLAVALREARDKGNDELYYPNEGHLSPQGHVLVARLLGERLAKKVF